MQSDISLCQLSSLKKGTVLSPIQIEELLAFHQHTKYEPLCRINYRSHSIEFIDLWSSLEILDNIEKIKISLIDAVLLKLQILHLNRKCVKLMELSDFKMDWTSSGGYGQIG